MLREKERKERGERGGEKKNIDWPRVSGENSSSHPQIICEQVSITVGGRSCNKENQKFCASNYVKRNGTMGRQVAWRKGEVNRWRVEGGGG